MYGADVGFNKYVCAVNVGERIECVVFCVDRRLKSTPVISKGVRYVLCITVLGLRRCVGKVKEDR